MLVNARLLVASLSLALLPAVGWSSDPGAEQRELLVNRAKWAHCGITSYQMRLRDEICFCPPPSGGPFRVTVKDGKIVKAVYRGQKTEDYRSGRVVPKSDYNIGVIETIEEVFARAEQVINSRPERSSFGLQHAPHKIRYHAEYGFPIEIWVGNPPHIADGQSRLVVDEFRPAKR